MEVELSFARFFWPDTTFERGPTFRQLFGVSLWWLGLYLTWVFVAFGVLALPIFASCDQQDSGVKIFRELSGVGVSWWVRGRALLCLLASRRSATKIQGIRCNDCPQEKK